MQTVRIVFAFLAVCGFATMTLSQQAAPPKPASKPVDNPFRANFDNDTEFLKLANLSPTDLPALLKYFHTRTLGADDQTKLAAVVKRLGVEDFDERLKASQDVLQFGAAAIGPLRTIAQDPNTHPEIAYRARAALKKIEEVPHARVATTAAKILAEKKTPGAVAAILSFLPMADTPEVAAALRTSLGELAVVNGKLDATLLAALSDPLVVRRAAAVQALLDGSRNSKPLVDELVPSIQQLLAKETDVDTRFQAIFSFATLHNRQEFIGPMIDLIADGVTLPRGRVWQIEDYLLQAASEKAPKARLGPTSADFKSARDKWQAWWSEAKKQPLRLEYQPRTTGSLLMCMVEQPNSGVSALSELGSDGKLRWRSPGVYSFGEAERLPNGNWLLTESNRSIVERSPNGQGIPRIQIQPQYGIPTNFQRQRDGKLLVTYSRMLIEYDAGYKETGRKYTTQNGELMSARRLNMNEILLLVRNPDRLVRLDENWKERPNPVALPRLYYQPRMQLLENEQVLIAEQQRIAQYDLKAMKLEATWTYGTSYPNAMQRLPNGNTLLVDRNAQLKEITPEGDAVWTYTPPNNSRVVRAVRD